MSIYKRGKVYWYKFMWNSEMVRESTRQGNQNTARQMEAAHRASLAKGEVGIREKKIVSTLGVFISQRFEPWAEAATSTKTWLDYYRPGIRTIQAYKPLANLHLNEITSENAADFAAWRQSGGLQGERHREHVVTFEEEACYLAAAPEPLGSVAAILADTGMRPDE